MILLLSCRQFVEMIVFGCCTLLDGMLELLGVEEVGGGFIAGGGSCNLGGLWALGVCIFKAEVIDVGRFAEDLTGSVVGA